MLTGVALVMLVMVFVGAASAGRAEARAPVPRSEAVRRLLRHIVRRPIGEVSEGDAAVVRGQVTALGDPLVAPLSGRPCVGYHVMIRHGVGGPILIDHARCGDFQVSDATGMAHVTGGELELAAIEAPSVTLQPPLPPAVRSWLHPGWHYQTLVATEGLLIHGGEVAVCGVMQAAIGAGDLYREGQAHRRLAASPTFPLVASPDRDLEAPSHRPVRPEQLRDQPMR